MFSTLAIVVMVLIIIIDVFKHKLIKLIEDNFK